VTLKKIEQRLSSIETLLRQRDKPSATTIPTNGHHPEYLTVPQFAERVGRNKMTVYKWVRLGQMPPGSVVEVQKLLRINWTVYEQSIRPRN